MNILQEFIMLATLSSIHTTPFSLIFDDYYTRIDVNVTIITLTYYSSKTNQGILIILSKYSHITIVYS